MKSVASKRLPGSECGCPCLFSIMLTNTRICKTSHTSFPVLFFFKLSKNVSLKLGIHCVMLALSQLVGQLSCSWSSRSPAVAVCSGLGKPVLIHFAGCIWWQFDSHCKNPLTHSGGGCRIDGWSEGETQTGVLPCLFEGLGIPWPGWTERGGSHLSAQ